MSSLKMSSDSLRLGEWLRQLREAKTELLRDVAAATAMDQAHLSKIELGQRTPTEEQAHSLARHFGIERQEMEARWIAERVRQDYGAYPAMREAVVLLADEAGVYRVEPKLKKKGRNE